MAREQGPQAGVATVGAHMTTDPHTVDRSVKLAVAHEIMRSCEVRHLPVLDDGRLVGIVTLSDLHLIETLRDVEPERVAVDEAMTEDPYAVGPDTPLIEVIRAMGERKCGSAIVVKGDAVIGIFTYIDALRALEQYLEPERVIRTPSSKGAGTARVTTKTTGKTTGRGRGAH